MGSCPELCTLVSSSSWLAALKRKNEGTSAAAVVFASV